jgi:hypothetical protein
MRELYRRKTWDGKGEEKKNVPEYANEVDLSASSGR